MKRIIYIICVVCLFTACCVLFAAADETVTAVNITFAESEEKEEIVAAATNFLHDYTENSYLYTSHDLTTYTVASLNLQKRNSISLESDVFSAYVRTRDYLKEARMQDQTDFLFQKAEYFKNVRMLQNIMRRDFEVAYHINLVKVAGDYAQVCITESKAFYYVDQEMQTFMDDTYEIFLYRSGEAWYVFDMITDDGFDTTYRNTNFKAAEKFSIFASNYSNQDKLSSEPDSITGTLPTETVTTAGSLARKTVAYNRSNAVNYAYTYSKLNVSSFVDYYNSNFIKILTDYGYENNADCMNFVSQCFYAGFYGSNDRTSILARTFPQDNVGTDGNESIWHANPTDHWAWTGISNFNNYLSYSANNTSETRMSATIYSYSGSAGSFSAPAFFRKIGRDALHPCRLFIETTQNSRTK